MLRLLHTALFSYKMLAEWPWGEVDSVSAQINPICFDAGDICLWDIKRQRHHNWVRVTGLRDARRENSFWLLLEAFAFVWNYRVSLLVALAVQTSRAQGEMASGKDSIISLITRDCREAELLALQATVFTCVHCPQFHTAGKNHDLKLFTVCHWWQY